MYNLASQLKVAITKEEGSEAFKEMVNGRLPKSKVVIFDLGSDDATNVRVYEFLSSLMDKSRIVIAGGAQHLVKYIPMPRIHDYTGIEDWTIPCGRVLYGEQDVKSAFYNL